MISKAGIKKIVFTGILFLLTANTFAQISSGRIVYERRTNLKKRYGDNPRMKNMITEQNKIRTENFELFFNDSVSVFKNIPDAGASDGGFMKMMTTRNTTYQNSNTRQKFIIMDLWGSEAVIKDSVERKSWKITENKRMISGYNCRKAIWQMNDSTRIYAWYAEELIPTVGPEGFEGLPGTILGLATEDGSVVYFAKEIKAMVPATATFQYPDKIKDVYTEEELKKILFERMGQWMKPQDLDAMFQWL
jgi:GLPGLI family protein